MKRILCSAMVSCLVAALTDDFASAQTNDLQTQAAALEQRITAAQVAWEKQYASIGEFSTANMPKWNALVDARSKELERLRDQRAQLAQQVNDSFSTQARDLNGRINQFKTANEVAASSIDFLNNVAQYRTRKEFEDNLAPMAKEWERKYGSTIRGSDPAMLKNIDDKFRKFFPEGKETGYSRVGNINPYTGEYYYKFYDKDGEWKFSVWSDAAKGWKHYQEDLKSEWRRHQDDRTDYVKRAKEFQSAFDRLDAVEKKSVSQLAQMKNRQVESIAGTSWGPRTMGNWEFRPGGVAVYNTGYGTYIQGTWKQSGNSVTAETSRADTGGGNESLTATLKGTLEGGKLRASIRRTYVFPESNNAWETVLEKTKR